MRKIVPTPRPVYVNLRNGLPYTVLDSTSETPNGNYRIFGLCLVAVMLVVSLLGGVYAAICLRLSSLDPTYVLPYQNHALEFDSMGYHHNETFQVSDAGDIFKVINEADGFDVTLDHGKKIALVKTTSSSVCYFTNIENIPDLTAGPNSSKQFRPLMVSEDELQMTSEVFEIVRFQFHHSGEIPHRFIEIITMPDISMQCRDQTSYWMEKVKSNQSRTKRGDNDIGVLLIIR